MVDSIVDPIVIATMDDKGVVISFMEFNNEDQLDRVMKTSKEKGLQVKTMAKSLARNAMLNETAVS